MTLWDIAKRTIQQLTGDTPHDALHKVSPSDHKSAIIKERPDLCASLSSEATEQTVRRDGSRDIVFLGWQVANVEERALSDNRRIAYLKLFKTRYEKFVCQRMMLIDDEEKVYTAQTVDTIEAARAFFGDDALTLALLAMYARQTASAPTA
ncbi:MAG: hypothetical protein ACRCRW_15315 [Aeromonadaceae bacterium]